MRHAACGGKVDPACEVWRVRADAAASMQGEQEEGEGGEGGEGGADTSPEEAESESEEF